MKNEEKWWNYDELWWWKTDEVGKLMLIEFIILLSVVLFCVIYTYIYNIYIVSWRDCFLFAGWVFCFGYCLILFRFCWLCFVFSMRWHWRTSVMYHGIVDMVGCYEIWCMWYVVMICCLSCVRCYVVLKWGQMCGGSIDMWSVSVPRSNLYIYIYLCYHDIAEYGDNRWHSWDNMI